MFVLADSLYEICTIYTYVRGINNTKERKKNTVALVRKRNRPTERLPLVEEVSVNFSG
jgi:hypothetical protein